MNDMTPLEGSMSAEQIAPPPTCEQCGEPFARRTGSGGKPQRFCSTDCRMAFHAQRPQRGATVAPTLEKVEPSSIPEPTPHQRRAMLIEGVKDFDAKFPQETAEAAVDRAIAEGKIKPYAEEGERCRSPDPDFDWIKSPDVVLHEQPQTAIYFNPEGALVIRQRADWNEENDPFVYICPNNIMDFIDKLCDVAGIPSVGGPTPRK